MQAGEATAPSAWQAVSRQPHSDMGAMGRKQAAPSGQWGFPDGPHADAPPGSATPVAREANSYGQPGRCAGLLPEGQRKGCEQLPSAHSPCPDGPAADMQPALLPMNGGPRRYPEEDEHGALQTELSTLKQQVSTVVYPALPSVWYVSSWMMWMQSPWVQMVCLRFWRWHSLCHVLCTAGRREGQ